MQELDGSPTPPLWASRWLLAAGVYNLAWGAAIIAFPHLLFDLTGAERINYPEIWQCVGMIVGVYGIGYLLAATDPRTHWPIVLVGLLGKIFGPIGFAVSLYRGVFPPEFGLTILTNDLLWWIPFAMILRDAARHPTEPSFGRQADCRFVHETRIAAPPSAVFAFHERPEALRELIPPWESVEIVEGPASLAVGGRAVLRTRLGPITLSWIARHTQYQPPTLFADEQDSGPFAYWSHQHRFLDDGAGGTLLRDEIQYALPGGLLGRVLGDWLVRRKLTAMFEYRHAVTRRRLEGQTTAAAPAVPVEVRS